MADGFRKVLVTALRALPVIESLVPSRRSVGVLPGSPDPLDPEAVRPLSAKRSRLNQSINPRFPFFFLLKITFEWELLKRECWMLRESETCVNRKFVSVIIGRLTSLLVSQHFVILCYTLIVD